LAQGILESKLAERGLAWQVDSAGTGYWHVGEKPDPRTIRVAQDHGIDIAAQRARQFSTADFESFDLLLTADPSVHAEVLSHARSAIQRGKVTAMVDFLGDTDYDEIPDPWYGGPKDFEEVFHLLDELCEAILRRHAD
jgi:protein-tyrosine phosphatase